MDVFPRQLRGGDPVDAYIAAVDFKETHQEIYHRGFSGAGRADDGNLLSRLHMGGKILDDDFVGVIGITEPHMVKDHLTLRFSQGTRLMAFIRKFFLLQKVKHAVACGRSCLHLRRPLRQCAQRRGKQAHIHNKRRDDAEGDLPVDCKRGAQYADHDIAQIADDIHKRLHHTGEELAPAVRVIDSQIQTFESLLNLPVRAGDPHHIVAGVHFLHVTVELSEALLAGGKILLGFGNNQHHDNEAKQRHRDGRRRHPPLGHEHHDQTAGKLCHGADDGRQTVGKRLLQRTDIVGHAAEDIAVRNLIEVFHRHFIDFVRKILSHPFGQIQGYGGHNIVFNIGKQSAEQV